MKIVYIILLFAVLHSCTESPKTEVRNSASYQIVFRPAFDESSRITFVEDSGGALVNYVLFKLNSGDLPLDTSYYISHHISKPDYIVMLHEVFRKIGSAPQNHRNGIRDGIWMEFSEFYNGDTTTVQLSNPQKTVDSRSVTMTGNALQLLRKLTSDTLILQHLRIVEKYIQ